MAKLSSKDKILAIEILRQKLREKGAALQRLSAKTRVSLKTDPHKTLEFEQADNQPFVENARMPDLKQDIRDIRRALIKIAANGDYGICENEDCGEEIPSFRLDEVPWARYCKGCQEFFEVAQIQGGRKLPVACGGTTSLYL